MGDCLLLIKQGLAFLPVRQTVFITEPFGGEGKAPSCIFLDQDKFNGLITECPAPYKANRVSWMNS